MIKERKIKVGYLTINLREGGFGGEKIICLHGWGRGGDSFLNLVNKLIGESKVAKKFKFFIPDLPGFGKSSKPKKIWGLRDYSIFLKNFLNKLRAKNVIIIAHSFGGQIAAYFSILEERLIQKLILIDPALIRQRSFKAKIAQKIPKKLKENLKKFPFIKKVIIKLVGSKDYEQATPKMKKIMKRIIEEDVSLIIDKIKIPTLIIWGEKDKITPPEHAIRIKNLIPRSELIFIKDAKHSPHIEKPQESTLLIKEFIL